MDSVKHENSSVKLIINNMLVTWWMTYALYAAFIEKKNPKVNTDGRARQIASVLDGCRFSKRVSKSYDTFRVGLILTRNNSCRRLMRQSCTVSIEYILNT